MNSGLNISHVQLLEKKMDESILEHLNEPKTSSQSGKSSSRTIKFLKEQLIKDITELNKKAENTA